ncbi:MAG: hypothetical protein P8X42_16785, partial [Calditrichaceae bacterium]
MKYNFKIIFAILIFVTGFEYGIAQNPVGTTAADFLGIAVGPKAYAMGGAYTAMISDVTSAYWNPGALAFIDQNYFS